MSTGLESTGPGGAMQDWSMRVTHVIDHAAREAGSREIVTRWADGTQTRTDWAGIRRDALKMAQALDFTFELRINGLPFETYLRLDMVEQCSPKTGSIAHRRHTSNSWA